MRVRVRHRTQYLYDQPACLGPHVVRLRPAVHARAQVLSYDLSIQPECEVRWQQDPWGNRIARLTFPAEEHFETVELAVEAGFDIQPVNPFDFYVDDRCERVPFAYPDGLSVDLEPYLECSDPGPRTRALIEETRPNGYVIDYLVELNRVVATRVGYVIRNEAGIQTSEQTLKIGTGSCRDSAVVLVDLLRAHGLAARFVSGYLVQLADEGILPDEAKGVSQDVVDLHAWAEVYLPGAGWVGLDGTSGLLCGEGHIPMACTARPEAAAPVSGTSSRAATGFHFEMSVERLGHEPRPRVPYTDEQWDAALRAGDDVDRALGDAGIELTCGGEPTWTSRLHPREREWITEAVGPTKWTQGLRLARELRDRLGTGTFVMQRMGKLYPGESLPRWNLHLLWREDGVPIWRDPQWLALSHLPAASGGDADAELARAHAFAENVTSRLDVAPALIEAYEDPWQSIRTEADLPIDVDPYQADLEDGEERLRLARVLSHGIARPVGYALPLQYQQGRWATAAWRFRRERLYLLAGDSPMGLRLPLDRLEGVAPPSWPVDTTTVHAPIAFRPERRQPVRRTAVERQAVADRPPSFDGPVRTALCIQPRDGVLYVFLPPLETIEAFLELVSVVEDAAADLGAKVVVEGYGPPHDPRIRSCLITPDPGVIEVNVPVCHSFAEYREVLEIAADAANHAGLCAEKYLVDGREVGSGGGNHLTLGGATPADSPFLQHPHLLGSLLRYLNNHPALSFLFTGLFVGPTSQAPRIDEARHDSVYELELALAQIPPGGAHVFPWTVDRLLRNLLVDVSGNTHRTEVCIDKLYDPNGIAGRLGIVEFRAFEMPPNERMAAIQMLLLRSLVAMFARAPYLQPLIRWGTRLHDQFLLPHFLWADMLEVTADLRRHGLTCDDAWFRPFLEHRCPRMGRFQIGDIVVELRMAIEPWPTLGEQPEGAVVSRYVDSSLERLQVKASGLLDGRYVLAVNGIELPMRPTTTAGESVAGIRFRAWQPPHCLQPAVPVHHPVHVDVVDLWGARSLGRCTYHVWHPEGRAFEEPPLTAFEAAARRSQRFTTEGHLPSPVRLVRGAPAREQPYTLDLRRFSVASDPFGRC